MPPTCDWAPIYRLAAAAGVKQMRKSVVTSVVAVTGIALLMATIQLRSPGYPQPHPFIAAAWLSSILAIGVLIVMLTEFLMYGRRIHLVFAAGFLCLGIMGIWDAVSLPAAILGPNSLYLAIWKTEWIALAFTLICGLAVNRSAFSDKSIGSVMAALGLGGLFGALGIFLLSFFPGLALLISAGLGRSANVGCAVVFLLCALIYSRGAFHRNNSVLEWLAYGLVFAILAQAADYLDSRMVYGTLFGFAQSMKIFAYLAPLVGMLAEHGRVQSRLRDQGSDLNNLIQVYQAAASSKSSTDLYQQIVELTSSSFGRRPVCLLPFDRDRGLLKVAASVGLEEYALSQITFRPGESGLGESFTNRKIVFVRDISNDEELSKKLEEIGGVNSALFAPVVLKSECLGVLAVLSSRRFRPGQKLQKDQVKLLEGFAGHAAFALEQDHLHGLLLDTAKSTDDNARETEIVWEIGQAVASKLEINDLVDTLAAKLKSAVGAKACSVLVYDADSVGLKIMGHRILTRHQSVSDHVDQCDQIAALVAKRGEPLVANSVRNSCHCKYPELVLDDGGMHHMLAVPMSTRGFIGAISVFRQGGDPFGEREKRLLVRLAPMVAVGIRNAELYEREKKIAESLQKCFLPEFESEMPGIEVSTLYQAAFDESVVGGDFYDISDLGDGKYGIAIGDVAGKGLDAAVYTSMARYMIQAYSADDINPAGVVSKLNAALYQHTPPSRFVTLVYGILDTNAHTFSYVNAGHELPFIYDASRKKIGSLQTTGPAAGAVDDAVYHSEIIPFEPEDTLILYTDGATDARNGSRFLGTDGLQSIIEAEIRKGYTDLPKAMQKGIRTFSDAPLRDDIAILTIKARTPGRLF